MSNLTKLVVNAQTKEKTVVPLTEEEIKAKQDMAEEILLLQAEQKAQAEAKAEAKESAIKKLTNLGLTEEEAKAIIES